MTPLSVLVSAEVVLFTAGVDVLLLSVQIAYCSNPIHSDLDVMNVYQVAAEVVLFTAGVEDCPVM